MPDQKTFDRKAPAHASGFDLKAAALAAVQQYGSAPGFPAGIAQQLASLASPPQPSAESAPDLRDLLWSSIDNDTSRDLDQIEFAQPLPDGSWKVMIAVADVDAWVAKDSPIDGHAAKETTTVFTGVQVFPMLPEQLSTGLTSLLEAQDRLALVTEFVVRTDGHLGDTDVYRARVRNHAQLTYSAVGAWLEHRGDAPAKVSASPELQTQLRLQNQIAQAISSPRRIRTWRASMENCVKNACG
ncbi:MAG: RNB domain-containing ribonuclease [Acidobacteriaceae bacterium]